MKKNRANEILIQIYYNGNTKSISSSHFYWRFNKLKFYPNNELINLKVLLFNCFMKSSSTFKALPCNYYFEA